MLLFQSGFIPALVLILFFLHCAPEIESWCSLLLWCVTEGGIVVTVNYQNSLFSN